MNKDVLKTKTADFQNLDVMSTTGPPEGRFSVTVNEANFECLFFRKSAERLFVVLHGSRDPQVRTIPVFERWSWKDIFPGSILYVADPTLELDPTGMKIGWYVGTQTNDYTNSLVQLVLRVAGGLGLGTSQIITYGSSGGGFAALVLASRLGDATAVCINPQTNILLYTPADVNNFLQLAFSGKKPGELTPMELGRLNATDAFMCAPNAKCLYVQNVQDLKHVKLHYLPFCFATGGKEDGGVSDNGTLTLLYEDAKGHGAEPETLAPKLISIAVELANGMDKARLAELLPTQPSVKVVVRSGLRKTDRSYMKRVQRALDALPRSSQSLAKDQAAAIIIGAFKLIAMEIDSANDGVVEVGGLGRFRILQAEQVTADRRRVSKGIVFQGASRKK